MIKQTEVYFTFKHIMTKFFHHPQSSLLHSGKKIVVTKDIILLRLHHQIEDFFDQDYNHFSRSVPDIDPSLIDSPQDHWPGWLVEPP